MVDISARQHAERLLRQALTEDYQKAHDRSDFFEATAKLHGAIEKSFNAVLEIDGFDNNGPNFRDKAFQVCPGPARRYNIASANHQRNQLIHVERPFSDTEVKQLADTFARFALNAWTSLFGPHARPPAIRTPTLVSERSRPTPAPPTPQRKQTTTPSGKQQRTRNTKDMRPSRSIAWRSLLLAIIFVITGAWWAGFTARLWQDTTDGVLLAVAAVVILLIQFVLAARHTWRFLRSLSIFRAVAITATGLIMLFFLSLPLSGILGAPQTPDNATSLRTSIRNITLSGLQRFSTFGSVFAEDRFLPGIDNFRSEEATRPSSTQTPPSPATGDVPASEATSTTSAGAALTIGAQVRVVTGGGRLRIRELPALSARILAVFEDGSVVTVVGGPHEGEEFIWWEVEGFGERGWCAGDYLATVAAP